MNAGIRRTLLMEKLLQLGVALQLSENSICGGSSNWETWLKEERGFSSEEITGFLPLEGLSRKTRDGVGSCELLMRVRIRMKLENREHFSLGLLRRPRLKCSLFSDFTSSNLNDCMNQLPATQQNSRTPLLPCCHGLVRFS